MDYLTSGNSCINEGISLVAWGAFLVSLGWFLVGKYRAIDRGLSRVQFFRKILIQEIIEILIFAGICASIIIGLKNIGEGSTLTTKGWNLLNVHSRRQNLIKSMVQEWVFNAIKMKRSPFTGLPYDELSTKFDPYPMFRTSALNGVITSGIWNYGEPNERRFLLAVSNYEMAIVNANQIFDFCNTDMLMHSGIKEQRIAKSVEYQSQILQSDWYHNLKVQHEKLGKLLTTEYRWAMLEQLDPNERKVLLDPRTRQTETHSSSQY